MSTELEKGVSYQPLDSSRSEIRLIRISYTSEDSTTDADGSLAPLALTLHTASLDDPSLHYFALSYVWGNGNDTVPITVGGAPFFATRNLVVALRVCRGVLGSAPDLYLWVDAVCINQRDVSERNEQVGLMGRIYRQTRKVLVWLGPGDDRVRAIFAFMRVWARTLQEWQSLHGLTAVAPPLLCKLDHVVKTALGMWNLRLASKGTTEHDDDDDNDNAEGGMRPIDTVVDVFYDRAYWSRMWTFQELHLPDEGIFICGYDIVVALSEVSLVLLWLHYVGVPLARQARPEEISLPVWRVLHDLITDLPVLPLFKLLTMKTDMAKHRGDGTGVLVSSLLRTTQFLQATDPHDLYYGLMGVMDLPLKIDYAAPVETVLTDASRMLCRGGNEMMTYLLSTAGIAAPRRGYGIPSWTTTRGNIDSLFRTEIFCNQGDSGGGFLPSCSEPSVLEDEVILMCEGVVVNSIEDEAAGSYWKDQPLWINTVSPWLDETMAFFFGCSSGYLLSDVVARGTPYVGGGTQFGALIRFWMQDNFSSVPNQYETFHEVLNRRRNDDSNMELLDTVQLFLLYCLLRERDLTRIEQLKTEENTVDPAFGERILRTTRFILDGLVKPAPDAIGDVSHAPPAAAITWEDVLCFTLYQRRESKPTEEALNNFFIQTFSLGHAALLRTVTGYIGVARAGIQSGDKVCVLAGAGVPVILRPLRGERAGLYQLVSYAFVVGLMNGEATDMVKRGTKKTERFYIY
ncbi:heterokaryon incompatibility protein-domain-containing protein [Biscogniauxia marginata]|nr:heterokaryon incompatibility protein-domain-containing protein [Biscogniauxia marginata]